MLFISLHAHGVSLMKNCEKSSENPIQLQAYVCINGSIPSIVYMTAVNCPVCNKQVVVPAVDDVELRFSAVTCQHCKSMISIHVTLSTIYVKVVHANKRKSATIDDEKLYEEMLVV
jgi:hypothetical protein